VLTECPWCGTAAVISGNGGGGRTPPIEVDGDLQLIDVETLRELEANTRLDDPGVVAKRAGFAGGPGAAQLAMKNQIARIATQKDLVNVIAKWAGKMRHHGYSDRMIHKRFYIEFDRTISECLAEPRADMLDTISQLESEI
jgi:hypothetical protein